MQQRVAPNAQAFDDGDYGPAMTSSVIQSSQPHKSSANSVKGLTMPSSTITTPMSNQSRAPKQRQASTDFSSSYARQHQQKVVQQSRPGSRQGRQTSLGMNSNSLMQPPQSLNATTTVAGGGKQIIKISQRLKVTTKEPVHSEIMN